jgi:hypothetical protein
METTNEPARISLRIRLFSRDGTMSSSRELHFSFFAPGGAVGLSRAGSLLSMGLSSLEGNLLAHRLQNTDASVFSAPHFGQVRTLCLPPGTSAAIIYKCKGTDTGRISLPGSTPGPQT